MQSHGFLSTLSVTTDCNLSPIMNRYWHQCEKHLDNHQSHFFLLLYVYFFSRSSARILTWPGTCYHPLCLHSPLRLGQLIATMPGATVQILILNMEPVAASILISIRLQQWQRCWAIKHTNHRILPYLYPINVMNNCYYYYTASCRGIWRTYVSLFNPSLVLLQQPTGLSKSISSNES